MPSLLSIAPEMRVEICCHGFNEALASPDVRASKPIHPLLQSCRQLRDEATAVYYQQVEAALAVTSTQLIELCPAFFSSMMSGQDAASLATELEFVGRRCEALKQLITKLDTMGLFQHIERGERVKTTVTSDLRKVRRPFDMFPASGQFGSATACVVPPREAATVEKPGILLGPAAVS